MLRVFFTPQLERFLEAPAREVEAVNAREALDAVFAEHPRLRGYVVDERGRVREHVAVFVGGELVRDDARLEEPLADGTEIAVMQALSGG